jgi:hypothetical protein
MVSSMEASAAAAAATAAVAALDPFFNSQQQQQQQQEVLQEGMVYIRISIMPAFKLKDIMLHHLQAPVFG